MTTVTRKPTPQPRATSLKRLLLIETLEEYSGSEYSNSDVIKSTIAVAASHRLMSDKDKGRIIVVILALYYTKRLLLSRQGTLDVSELSQFCQKLLLEHRQRCLQSDNQED